MEDYTTFAYVPVEKKYRVQRNKFHGKKYEGNCDGLAQWYYTNMNYNTDNIKIYIFGDLHQTIPNPYHLSVEYEEENGNRTERYHMIPDGYGNFYKQDLYRAALKKKKKKKKSKKKKKK